MSILSLRRVAPAALASLLALAAPGCGGPTEAFDVSGTVERGGRPLAGGSILFQPEAADGATARGGLIADGRYVIPAESGLRPGRYRVEILPGMAPGEPEPEPGRAIDPITGADVPLLGAPAPAAKGRRPPASRPGRRREFSVEVTEPGPNEFDFRLQD